MLERKAMLRIGFPWSQPLVARTRATVGGAVLAAQTALKNGISGQIAGGTHHAHREFGSGYCVYNDQAIAANQLFRQVTFQLLSSDKGDTEFTGPHYDEGQMLPQLVLRVV